MSSEHLLLFLGKVSAYNHPDQSTRHAAAQQKIDNSNTYFLVKFYWSEPIHLDSFPNEKRHKRDSINHTEELIIFSQ